MDRRLFLRCSAFAAAFAMLPSPLKAQTAPLRFDLTIEPTDVEMVDGELVYMLLFFQKLASGAMVPRPVLRMTQGQTITISLTNNAPEPHAFRIPGVPDAAIPPIPRGATQAVTFTAPRGGTYLYFDPARAPVNRLLGLHGAMVVRPTNGLTLAGAPTPYSQATQTEALQQYFNALGRSPRFPGNRWNPNDPAREKIWLFAQVDPSLNARAEARQPIDLATVTSTFLPRYFTINGLSGYDLHDEPSVTAYGRVGQPTLIRTLNAGLATHSPHIHGNHVGLLSSTTSSGTVITRDNVPEIDTWTLAPLERVDVLLPFRAPPDVPRTKWPPRQEPFPMRYPMHCHVEMSQTAAGGNYPQGAIVHWELTGPLASS